MNQAEAVKIALHAHVRVCKGVVCCADPPLSPSMDAVFPVCGESIFIAEHMAVPRGGRVLDLCTGTGILAIKAAELAAEVIATDISLRAARFAQANVILNDVADEVRIVVCDLFTALKPRSFDLIVANPPFEPTPVGMTNYRHSDGGPFGTAALSRIVAEAPNYLTCDGTLQLFTFTFLGPRTFDLVTELGRRFAVHDIKKIAEISNTKFADHLNTREQILGSDTAKQVKWRGGDIEAVFVTATGPKCEG